LTADQLCNETGVMSSQVEVLVSGDTLLGECPLWSQSEQLLYWIDIDGRSIRRFDPASGRNESFDIPGRPGSLALTSTPGQLLIATEHQLGWLAWGDPNIDPWLDLEAAGAGIRLNDGRTDPAGRFVVGSMHDDHEVVGHVGTLHIVDPAGTRTAVRSGIGISNGLAFDPERGRMYFADSLARKVWAYEYDLEIGRAGDPVVFIDFELHRGAPDGACVDADGCYWVAAAFGSAVYRFTPDGALDTAIELPVRKPTMPAFGGPDLDTLFVTSMGYDWGEDPDSPVPPGSLLAIDVGVTGRIDPPFGIDVRTMSGAYL